MGTKVLVVDDSMMVRQQVRRALVSAGFDVFEAKDGLEDLGQVRVLEGIALVICDVHMPNMSGLEFLQALRDDPAFAATPVVMLTTEGQAHHIEKAEALGAKAWILKPFKAELVIAAVKKLTAEAA